MEVLVREASVNWKIYLLEAPKLLYMYVSMYVCMDVCMYACMHRYWKSNLDDIHL